MMFRTFGPCLAAKASKTSQQGIGCG